MPWLLCGKESELARDILLPLIVLYMSCLVLAAWPPEIRPSALDGVSPRIRYVLESVGIRAGMSVFGGRPDKQTSIARAHCIVVKGTDSKGSETQLYPVEACPREGFRWKPEIYEHMIFHWVLAIGLGGDRSNLWAIGDHFCNSSPALDIVQVEITRVTTTLHYETGRESSSIEPVGRMTCRS